MSAAAAAAAEILARWRRGWRFAPQPEADGRVAFPPGFVPAPWMPAYRMSPAQAAVLAEARLNAIALQAKAGPLSRRRASHFNPD